MATDAAGNKRWLGYTLYVIGVTILLLYMLFPAKAVENVLDSSIRRINRDLSFKAGTIRPWVPAGLRITAGNIFLAAMKQPILTMDSMYVGPQFLKLVRGEYSVDLHGRVYDGDVRGTLQLGDQGTEIVSGDLAVHDLVLKGYPLPVDKFHSLISGRLNGAIAYGRASAEPAGGGASLELNLSDGQLQLAEPIFTITSVDLQSIKLEAKVTQREATIIRAELAGQEFNGTLSGSILLDEDLNRSQINLKGTLEPQAEFYRKHPDISELMKTMKKRTKRGQYFFAVTGTLGDPKLRLL